MKKIHFKNKREKYIYDVALTNGTEQGKSAGYQEGYQKGYQEGYRKASDITDASKLTLKNNNMQMAQKIIDAGAQVVTSMAHTLQEVNKQTINPMNRRTAKLLKQVAKSQNVSLKKAKKLWNETVCNQRGKLRAFLQT